jgi:pimeloyl-ACP methyl ester carboxylesterase
MRIFSLVSAVLLASAATAGPVRGQELGDCETRFGVTARCAWHDVAENRGDPAGRKIRLRVVVLPASGGASAEPIVWFPGGPGQAASDLIPLATQVYGPARETRDFVFIGQRGTGESNPLHCTVDMAADPSSAFGALFRPDRIRECYAEALRHADPAYYTTQHYVEDIDEVLTALGYGRAILWGGSGGTRTAQVFLREHPDRVVAVAMDGVTPIDYGMPLPFSKGVQTAWERIVEDCADQSDCAAAYPDLANDLASVFARVDQSPATARITLPEGRDATVSVEHGDLAYAIRGILYNSNASAGLPKQVHAAAETGDLSFFAQSSFDRSVALRSTVVAMGLHLSAYCAEDVPRIRTQEVGPGTSGTFMGSYLLEQYGAACEAWPSRPLDDNWFRPLRSNVPVLLISGYYDPSTPAAAADRVAKTLTNSLHIVVRNSGHGSGFRCARPAVLRFLETGSLEGVSNPCPEEPIHFEVGSN